MAVAKVKAEAYNNLYDQLDTREVEAKIYKIAKHRKKKATYFNQIRCIRDENSKILIHEKDVKKRWKKYLDRVLNEEFDRQPVELTKAVTGMVTKIINEEVSQIIQKIKKGTR
ncbi:uncharacterized protein [Diabrotica undecimpunctata]|uniref:uncharacterized protein n=1 Tax=Diabrotica undecimpunctata TaxID=50387 RepID=UPI003B63A144